MANTRITSKQPVSPLAQQLMNWTDHQSASLPKDNPYTKHAKVMVTRAMRNPYVKARALHPYVAIVEYTDGGVIHIKSRSTVLKLQASGKLKTVLWL